jgi:hypothetical protein
MRNKAESLAEHPVAYSVLEFCREFSIGRSTAYEEMKSGRLKYRKCGVRTIIAYEDAIRWLRALPGRLDGDDW